MGFRQILIIVLSLFSIPLWSADFNDYSQVSEAKVKAALILNFAQNIQWKDEANFPFYQIGIVDKDSSVFKELKIVQSSHKIKGKSFHVSMSNDQLSNLSQYNILFLSENSGRVLSNIYQEINGKGVLLITERSSDRVLTMINITYSVEKKTFSFEVNKENLDANGFYVNPKLLLLGGSFINVKELYIQTYEQLHKESEKIQQYKIDIERISKEKEDFQAQTNELNQRILSLALSIKQSEEEYKALTSKLQNKDSLLSLRTYELQSKIDESRTLQNLIKSQLNSIQNATSRLDSLDLEIDTKQKDLQDKQLKIDQQNKEITQQDLIILKQQKRFLISVLVLLGFALSLIFAYWSYRIKRRLNQKLERLVDERTQELQFSRKHFVNLFESSPVAMIELDLSELKSFLERVDYKNKPYESVEDLNIIITEGLKLIRVINLNQSGIDLFGFKNKDDAQIKYSQTYCSQSFKDFNEVFNAIIEGKSYYDYEGVRQTVNGDLLYVILKWLVLPGYEQNYAKVLLSVSDITALKNYQRELNRHKDHLEEIVLERTNEIIKLNNDLTITNAELHQKTEELSQIINMLKETQNQLIQSEKMASLGMLTAGIAHEINNPVNYISGSYQALQSLLDDFGGLLSEFRASSINQFSTDIFYVVEKEKNLNTDDLMYSMKFLLSNIETGINRTTEIVKSLMAFSRNERQEFIDFNIRSGIKDVLVILKTKYHGRITITEDFDSDFPIVYCNANGISQVLMNIISNAIDSIPSQGEIKIIGKYIAKSDEVIISVKDSGIGIPDGILDKIFDPFFTTKEVGKGTGLGLYISYNMIKSHQGTIDVETESGVGTTFIIRLPRAVNQKEKLSS